MQYNLEELESLNIDQFGETTFGNYTINVQPDDMSESPREWENLGTMVYWHRNYILGDVDGSKEYGEYSTQCNFWIELAGIEDEGQELNMEHVMELARERNVILPLYLYDHSGITMNTGGFSCPWDSGQVGFIYVSKETIRKEFGAKRISKQMVEKVEGYLRNEVKTFDDYITGNVYSYNIVRTDSDGEEIDIDSCCGFLGDPEDYMFKEIKTYIKLDIEATPQQAELF